MRARCTGRARSWSCSRPTAPSGRRTRRTARSRPEGRDPRRGRGARVSADTLRTLRREVRDQLRVRIDARGLASAPPAERRVRVRDEALDLLRERGALLPQRELNRIVNEVSDDVVGFGPIESLLKDPTVTEVMVNGPDDVFVESKVHVYNMSNEQVRGPLCKPGCTSESLRTAR